MTEIHLNIYLGKIVLPKLVLDQFHRNAIQSSIFISKFMIIITFNLDKSIWNHSK